MPYSEDGATLGIYGADASDISHRDKETSISSSSRKRKPESDIQFEIKLHLALDHSMPLVQMAAPDSSKDTYGSHMYTTHGDQEMNTYQESPDLGLLEPLSEEELSDMVVGVTEIQLLERKEAEETQYLGDIDTSDTAEIDLTESLQQEEGRKIDVSTTKRNLAPVEAASIKDTMQGASPHGIARSSTSSSTVNSHASQNTVGNHTSSSSESLMAKEDADIEERTSTDLTSSLSSKGASFNSMSLNFVKTRDIHTCLFCVDSGTATAGPVTPAQYSSLLSRHRAFGDMGYDLRDDEDDNLDADMTGSYDAAAAAAAADNDSSSPRDLHRSNLASDLDNGLVQAAKLAAGLGHKPRSEWTEEEINRVYNAVALAPASVNDIINRMIGNISVYFDHDDSATDTAYWHALAAYFDVLAKQDAQDVSKMALQDAESKNIAP